MLGLHEAVGQLSRFGNQESDRLMLRAAAVLKKTGFTRAIIVTVHLSIILALSGFPASARHGQQSNAQPDPTMNQQVQPSAGGIDKWHAPPVPTNWGFPELNVAVANFAVDHLTKKVGNGECWTLAKQALVAAGAQPPSGYVFGRELTYGEPWLPGDILQFTNCQFVDVQPNRRSTTTLGTPNHTAIVYSVANGNVVILQQNVNNDKHVQTQTLNFSNMVSGNLIVYRPIPANGSRQR